MTDSEQARDDGGYLIVEDWRPLKEEERAVLTELFQRFPPEDVDWVSNLSTTAVRWTASDVGDYRRIDFECRQQAEWPEQLQIDLTAPDEDGVPVMLLCFTRAQRLVEIEFIRADGGAIQRMPRMKEFAPWEGDKSSGGSNG